MRIISRVRLIEGGNVYEPGAEVPGLSRERAEHLASLGIVQIEQEAEPEPEREQEPEPEAELEAEVEHEPAPEPEAEVAAVEEPPRHRAVRRRRRKG